MRIDIVGVSSSRKVFRIAIASRQEVATKLQDMKSDSFGLSGFGSFHGF